MRIVSALPVLAVLSFALPAGAAAPAPPAKAQTTPAEAAQPVELGADGKPLSPGCVRKFAQGLARFDQIGGMLKLTATQKPVYEEWKTTRMKLWKSLPCPPLMMTLNVPAPTRLRNQITQMSLTVEALKKVLPATDALYKVLTPEQRNVFDGPKAYKVGPNAYRVERPEALDDTDKNEPGSKAPPGKSAPAAPKK